MKKKRQKHAYKPTFKDKLLARGEKVAERPKLLFEPRVPRRPRELSDFAANFRKGQTVAGTAPKEPRDNRSDIIRRVERFLK
jgi:hypothetical protein